MKSFLGEIFFMFLKFRLKYNHFLFLILLCFTLLNQPIFSQQPNAINYFNKAQQLIHEYNYFEATTELRKALKINPYYFEAQVLLGDCYFQLKNYATAWDIYIQAQSLNQDNVLLLNKLAKTKIALSDKQSNAIGALYYLKKAFALAPRNPDVISTFGYYYYILGDYSKAMEYYQKLGDHANNLEIYLNKAKVYEQWGDTVNWFQELKNAEAISSNNYDVALQLGRYFHFQKNINSAIEYLSMAQSINPQETAALMEIIQIYIDQKNFQEAIPQINKLIQKDPTNPEFYYLLGVCYEFLGEYDRSLDILQQGLQYDFGNEFLRTKAEEIAIFQTSISSDQRKNLSQYYNNLLSEHISPALSMNMISLLKRSLRIHPLSLNLRMQLANFYRQHGFVYEYLRVLKSGLLIEPNNQKLKDNYELNQKFISTTLEAKENIPAFSSLELHPVLMIGDVINQGSKYPFFEENLKELVVESLNYSNRLSAFIKNRDISKNKIPDFEIRLIISCNQSSVNLKADLIYLKTNAIYKSYHIREYGNNKLKNAVNSLRDQILKEASIIGKILKINENSAIINIGAMQGLQKNDKVLILKDNHFSIGVLYPSSKDFLSTMAIASGTVVNIGENIAKILFKPLDSIVFNMVQENLNVLVLKKDLK